MDMALEDTEFSLNVVLTVVNTLLYQILLLLIYIIIIFMIDIVRFHKKQLL